MQFFFVYGCIQIWRLFCQYFFLLLVLWGGSTSWLAFPGYLHLQNSRIESRSSIFATTRNISYLDHFIKEEGSKQIRDAIGFDYDFLMVQKLGRYSHISRSPEMVISFLGSTFKVTRRQVRNIKDGKTTPRAWPVLDSQARKGKLKTDLNYIKNTQLKEMILVSCANSNAPDNLYASAQTN